MTPPLKNPGYAPDLVVRVREPASLGTLRSNDATATRTSFKKVHLCSFSLYRDYSYPITLLNVGELS